MDWNLLSWNNGFRVDLEEIRKTTAGTVNVRQILRKHKAASHIPALVFQQKCLLNKVCCL